MYQMMSKGTHPLYNKEMTYNNYLNLLRGIKDKPV